METFTELEEKIDKKQTIQNMKKEMEQLYYFTGRNYSDIEAFYVRETEAVYDVGKDGEKKKQLLHRSNTFANEIMKFMKKLPEKEQKVLDALYVCHLDRKMACKKLHITNATLRRRNQDGLYHLAILMRRFVLKET